MTPAAPYFVPESGVLNWWSAEPDDDEVDVTVDLLKLKIVKPLGGSTYRIVGEDPTTRGPDRSIHGSIFRWEVQIPVRAGQLLALWHGTGSHPCAFVGSGEVHYRAGSNTEPAVGDTFETDAVSPGQLLNASANLVTKKCNGKAPTMAGDFNIDRFFGTADKDVILGRGGSDTIKARRDKDALCGGGLHDVLKGGGGNDKIKGGKGDDTIKGGRGIDTCIGGPGDDIARKFEITRSALVPDGH